MKLRSALGEEAEARIQLEKTEASLRALHLQSQRLDALLDQDRRLREVRLSGSTIALILARIGNAFPQKTWLNTMRADESGYSLAGQALNLTSLRDLLAALVKGGAVLPAELVRVTRDSSGWSPLSFEIRGGTSP